MVRTKVLECPYGSGPGRYDSLASQAHSVHLASYRGRWGAAGRASFNEEFTRLELG